MTCYAAAYKGTLKASAEIEEMIWLQPLTKTKYHP
jgi:hypothetical protein